MLKIKDNVDLKELEKFGFVYDKTYNMWRWASKGLSLRMEINIDIFRNLSISDPTRMSYWCKIPSVILDLIQEGLVEKVSD